MRALRLCAAWLAALLLRLINLTCRVRLHDDPRPALRASGQRYIYAILHAHQVAAGMNHGEPLCGAMVSRSTDGDLLIPLCRLSRIRPFRGSTRKAGKDKGGAQALEDLAAFVSSSGNPCTMAVDGPRGPRNHVHAGVARLAITTGARVVAAVAVPSRRWILRGTWDRLQLPKPFSTLDLWFAPPIDPTHGDEARLRNEVKQALDALELGHDRDEHLLATAERPARGR